MQVETLSESSQFEPKISGIINVLPLKLEQSLRSIIKREGYITCKVNIKNISTNGGNYFGELYEVDVLGKTKVCDQMTNMFIKSINGRENIMAISVPEAYKKEMYVYKELVKIFEELQEDANVPLNERYNIVKSYDESNTEAIILENIAQKGFKTYHRMDLVPLKFAELAVKELAKFHGLSFVLREKRPDYFAENLKVINQPFILDNDWDEVVSSIFNIVIENTSEDLKEKVKESYFKIKRKYKQYMEDKTIKCCLCHGDYKPSNIMTQFINGEATNIIPVDYQFLYYGSPVFDFIYFIFLCTDKSFRQAHLGYLKAQYYKSLEMYLKHFGIDVSSIYPKDKFENEYKECLDYGLFVAYILLPFMMASQNDVPDITKNLTGISFQVDERYKDRLQGIVEDFIDWGYI